MYWVKDYQTDDYGIVIELTIQYFEILGTVNIRERKVASLEEFAAWYLEHKLL